MGVGRRRRHRDHRRRQRGRQRPRRRWWVLRPWLWGDHSKLPGEVRHRGAGGIGELLPLPGGLGDLGAHGVHRGCRGQRRRGGLRSRAAHPARGQRGRLPRQSWRHGTCITGRNLDVRRTDIRGCENGLDADNYVAVTDSYVHDLYNSADGGPHTDGLQAGIGAHVFLGHNVFYGFTTGCTFPNDSGSCNGTSAVNIGGQLDVATVEHTSVSRNLLAGGAYTMYCPALPPTDFVVSQNYFSTVYSGTAPAAKDRDRVGEYGPQTGCDGAGVVASGNKLFDSATRRAMPLVFTVQ